MDKISHLICGKPLWQARQTFLTKHTTDSCTIQATDQRAEPP
jgi:hypothetical protein